VVLFNDPVIQALDRPMVDVVTVAKTDLKAGTVLDGLGGYRTYGEAENADTTIEQDLLPIGLAEGCLLKRDVKRDEVLTYADVEVPAGRLCDKLRAEQNARFFGKGTPQVEVVASKARARRAATVSSPS
jgi:predicted homoserine dehydrogenase-like protein